MRIRSYETKDAFFIERICLGKEKPENEMDEALKDVFSSFYIEAFPSDIFVLDEGGEAKGYILCAPNFKDFKEKGKLYCSKFSNNPYVEAIFEGCLNALKEFAKDYPAHFHIDLSSEVQRKGYGSLLISVLEEHLLEQGVKGVMLNVAKDNEKAIRFYEKNGYLKLVEDENQMAMGKRLGGLL